MNEFIGKYLSLNCGDLGVYQGRIKQVTASTIKLDKACCNGVPKPTAVEIPVRNIQTLEILQMPTATSSSVRSKSTGNTTGRVKVERPVAVRAPASSDIRASPRKMDFPAGSDTMTRASPRKLDIPALRRDRQRQRLAGRDEEAFGSPVDTILEPDFDFEKNLALFDKKAVYDEINASKPDLVRQVDKNNYRCNEHVLQRQATRFKQIQVPLPDSMEYVTDTGLVVPSVTTQVRRRLLGLAEEAGLTFSRQAELVGRAATETALHLLGGAHRLNPHNHHQCPSVAVLCGIHRAGLQAASAARQLASHGVRTVLYVEDSGAAPGPSSTLMLQELQLLRNSGVKVTNNMQDLCTIPVDLIIIAIADPYEVSRGASTAASRWAQSNRASLLALDPPPLGTAGVTAKCSLVPALPLSLDSSNGRIYLCNIGLPINVFKSVGIEYLPPFGPKFVIPLHPNDA